MRPSSGSPNFLAVIPARGGSRRIPRKNVREFLGIPLVGRIIRTAQASGIFESIVVSTDDLHIANVCEDFGAEIPFIRRADLSDDHTATASVVRDAITRLEEQGRTYKAVCCIYPTAILITADDLRKSLSLFLDMETPGPVVACVVSYSHPIQRALTKNSRGLLQPREPESITKRSQDLAVNWHDAGQFYWALPDRWKSTQPILNQVAAFEVPSWRVQDLDTEADWQRAEIAYEVISRLGY